MSDPGAGARRGAVPRFRPRGTYGLIALIVATFIAQQLLHAGPRVGLLGVNGLAATALGALDHGRVLNGEWWRLLTSALLHGDLLHLAFNGIALFLGGVVLEQLVGRRWMLALFVIGAVGGGAGSMLLNPADVVSLGASGAIVGQLVGGMVLAGRLPKGMRRRRLRIALGQVAIPALIPIALVHAAGNIDYAGHLGGAVAGGAASALLLAAWSRRPGPPPGTTLAAVVVVAAIGVVGWGVSELAAAWPESMNVARMHDELMPDEAVDDLPDMTDEELEAATAEWSEDPRPPFMLAERSIGTDATAAVRWATEALSRSLALEVAFPNGELEAAIHVTRLAAADALGDEAMVAEDIEVLCGRFSDTDGGAWARANGLCDSEAR